MPKMHEFKAGDRLRSKRSGRVWVYALEDPPIPVDEPYLIPVRDELWAPEAYLWMHYDIFEHIDDDYIDPSKAEHIS